MTRVNRKQYRGHAYFKVNEFEVIILEYNEILRLIKSDLSDQEIQYRDNDTYLDIKSMITDKIDYFWSLIESIEDKTLSLEDRKNPRKLDLTSSMVSNRIFLFIGSLYDYSLTVACPSYEYEIVRLSIKRAIIQHNKLLRALNMEGECFDVKNL
jgi:hypothetical protein